MLFVEVDVMLNIFLHPFTDIKTFYGPTPLTNIHNEYTAGEPKYRRYVMGDHNHTSPLK